MGSNVPPMMPIRLSAITQRSTLINQVTTSNAISTPRDTPPKTYGDTEPWLPSADPLAINEASTSHLLEGSSE